MEKSRATLACILHGHRSRPNVEGRKMGLDMTEQIIAMMIYFSSIVLIYFISRSEIKHQIWMKEFWHKQYRDMANDYFKLLKQYIAERDKWQSK